MEITLGIDKLGSLATPPINNGFYLWPHFWLEPFMLHPRQVNISNLNLCVFLYLKFPMLFKGKILYEGQATP